MAGIIDKMRSKRTMGGAPMQPNTPAEGDLLAMMGGAGGANPAGETPQEQGAEGETSARDKLNAKLTEMETGFAELKSMIDAMP